jgi:hypothetical protein
MACMQFENETPQQRGYPVHHLGDERPLLRFGPAQVQQGEAALSQMVPHGNLEVGSVVYAKRKIALAHCDFEAGKIYS